MSVGYIPKHMTYFAGISVVSLLRDDKPDIITFIK